ncbi:MAG: translation initiation factor IF-2 subunit beta [Candidatus Bathyarchaeia archaeon]
MRETSYREMLERAYDRLPHRVEKYERFEVPRPRVAQVGKRTVLLNFKEISEALNRDPKHLLKFLSREMATLASTEGTRVIFQGVFRQDTIRNLIETYTQRYVICPVCKRPDTKIVKEKRLSFLVCEACGARSSIG